MKLKSNLKFFFVIAVLLVIPVLAVHISNLTLYPELTAGSKETEFSVNITNEGKDNINEVRVRIPVEFSALKCGAAPNGWSLAYSDAVECNYKTVSVYLAANNSLVFTVKTTTASEDGNNTWEIRTRDVFDGFSLHNPITIVDAAPPTIKNSTLEAPNGGERWDVLSQRNILWHWRDINDSNLGDKPIALEYSTDAGKTWVKIDENEANDGMYPWTLPNVVTNNARVRITVKDKAGNTVSDSSDAPFSIVAVAPTVTINVGETKVVNNTKITVKGVSADAAVLIISSIAAPTPAATPAPTGNATNVTMPGPEKGILTNPTVTAIVVILIIIILYLIWRLQDMEKKKK